MAVIHHTTLNPTKLELLAAWLPAQPWYRDGGGAPDLAKVGGFRLDDPAGRVGLEFMVVTDAATGTSYHAPMAYRDHELPGAEDALIGTTEHGVLGHRWVYDGARDPVLVTQLVALIQGRAEPQAQSITGTPDPTVTSRPATGPGPNLTLAGPVTATSTPAGTELLLADGTLIVWINRVLHPGEDHDGPGVSAPWHLPDGTEARATFITARHEPPSG
ncbi:MAG TPA: 1,4-alpha-glucan branching protein [Streptosporangiaceae bacterium]|nr:1,4-alpha-glucan branching protein [Streptosporangiaceae bacterium]